MQAVLSRAELLLSSRCSQQTALDAAVSAMDGVVDAWTRVEAAQAEKRRKEAEILKYKMQEHVVSSRILFEINTVTRVERVENSCCKTIMLARLQCFASWQSKGVETLVFSGIVVWVEALDALHILLYLRSNGDRVLRLHLVSNMCCCISGDYRLGVFVHFNNV